MICNQVIDKAVPRKSVALRLAVLWGLQHMQQAWWLPVVLATIGGAVVRFIHLDAQSLWLDEYLWVLLGSNGLKTITPTVDGSPSGYGSWLLLESSGLTAIMHTADGYPPGYGFLVHFLLRAGLDSDWWLRAPSAVAGTLAIPLAYYVGRHIEGHAIAAIAAALLAIHPLAVWYSLEVGAYSFMMLCTLLSTYCLLALLRGGSLRHVLGYALSTSLGFGFHYYFIFVVAAHVVVVVRDWMRYPARRRMWLWTVLLTIAAAGIWGQSFLVDLASQSTQDSARSFSWLALPYTALTFVGGFSLGPSLRTLHPSVSTGVPVWDSLEPWLLTTLLAIAVSVALTLMSWARRLRTQHILVLVMLLCPILGAWLGSAVLAGYRPRYVLPALPFALLWFTGSLRTPLRRVALVLLALFTTLALVGLVQIHTPLYAREDNRSAARYATSQDGKAPVVLLGLGTDPFTRYAKGRRQMLALLPHDVQDDATLQQALTGVLTGSQGFWLVSSRPWTIDPTNRVQAFLQSRLALREETMFAGVTVQFYTNGQQ